MPSSSYVTAKSFDSLNFVAAEWIERDSATPEAVWVLHQTEGKKITTFYILISLPLLSKLISSKRILFSVKKKG